MTRVFRQSLLRFLPTVLLAIVLACRGSGDRAQLLIGGYGDQRSPAWMTDGKRIVCSSARAGYPAHLYLCDLETGTSRPLTNAPYGDNCPAVSPNGQWVAFHSDRAGQSDIYRLDLATSEIVRLTSSPYNDRFPTWSPDGKRIAFHSEAAGDPDIWLMDFDGANKIPLVMQPGMDTTSAWSPDGKKIAFSSEASGNPDIWQIYLADRRMLRLTRTADSEWKPVWSPDGRQIVYCRGRRGGPARLWIMNPDGTHQRPLSSAGNWDDFDSAWSPDGLRLAFECNRNGHFDIWAIRF